jgi:hypothetical protein
VILALRALPPVSGQELGQDSDQRSSVTVSIHIVILIICSWECITDVLYGTKTY